MDRVLRFFNLYVCLDIALDGELAKLDQEAEFFASQLDEEDAVEDIKLNRGVIYAAKKLSLLCIGISGEDKWAEQNASMRRRETMQHISCIHRRAIDCHIGWKINV